MADNSNPKGYNPLVQHLTDAADGAKTHGAAIGLTHNDEAHIRTDLVALTGAPAGPGGNPPAQPGLKMLWNTADSYKCAMTAALRTVCSNARLFARTCIHSLMPVLGEKWNSNWKAAGFTGSLAVPDDPTVLLQQLRAYYSANPTREATVQDVACTAAACATQTAAVETAQTNSNQSNADAGIAHRNFLNGITAGRNRLSGLRTELDQLIPDDDDRWYAFGFDKPSDPNTPAVPANLTVTAGAPGSKLLICDWDDPRRADSCRVRAVLKSDGKTEAANEIVQDSQDNLTLDTLASGTVVIVTVTARNATGESQPGNAVEIAVP